MMMQKHTPTFPKNFHLPISQGVLQYKREKITRIAKHRPFHSYMKGRRKTHCHDQWSAGMIIHKTR